MREFLRTLTGLGYGMAVMLVIGGGAAVAWILVALFAGAT